MLLPFHGTPTQWYSDISSSVSPASGDFLDALQPVIYSRTVVGLGLPEQTTVQDWLDDDSNLIISIPAYHAMAWSVIGPKSGSATPVTRTATGGKFPVVAHPITGAFAYGTGSGFV